MAQALEITEGTNVAPAKSSRRQEYRKISQVSMQYQPEYHASQTKIYCRAIHQVLLHLALIYCLFGVTYLLFVQTNAPNCTCSHQNRQNISTIIAAPTVFDFTSEPSLNPSVSAVYASTTQQSTSKPSKSPTNAPVTTAPTSKPMLQPTLDHSVYEHYIGDYKISSQNSSHGNWLLCDGSFVNSKDYPKLFALIRHLFGAFTGYPLLFALPDASDRVVGIHGESNTMGHITGNQYISLKTSHLPSHDHLMVYGDTGDECSSDYSSTSYPYLAEQCFYNSGLLTTLDDRYELKATSNLPNRYHTNNTGLGNSFNVMQPTVFVGNLFVFAD